VCEPLPGPLDNRFSQLYQQLRPDSLPGLPCLERSTSPTIEICYHIHQAGERDPTNHRGVCPVAGTYCRVQTLARGIPSGCSISPEGQGINDQLIETKGPDPLLSLRGTIISIIPSWFQSFRRWERCCKSAKALIQQAIREVSGSLAAAILADDSLSTQPRRWVIFHVCKQLHWVADTCNMIEKLPIAALVPATGMR
jgi:hypothetical protein